MAAMSLSVVHVALSLDAGGLERVILDLAREGRALGQAVSILCIEKPGVLAGEADRAGAKLYSVDKGPGLRWETVRQVRSVLAQVKPDVIHTHQIAALLYVTGAGRGSARVLVHTEHNNQLKRFKTLREKTSYLSCLAIGGRRTDRFFGVSADSSQALLRTHLCSADKVFTVINGIDLARFKPNADGAQTRASLGIPQDALVFGTVGRLNEMKRQDIFLATFAKIAERFASSYAVLVGDGPLRNALGRQAQELGIANRCIFTGFQPNPERFLCAFDAFVQTSRMEGLPLAILEAAASGVPVVASRVGGIEEVSNSGRSILIYDFGDDDALTSAVFRLASDPVYRREIGESGRRHVLAEYSSARMAGNYQRHYFELLGQPLAEQSESARSGVSGVQA